MSNAGDISPKVAIVPVGGVRGRRIQGQGHHRRRRSPTALLKSMEDGLLLKHLLPRLPMDAAVRTSALGSRWRGLWKEAQDISLCDLVCQVRSFSDLVDGVLAHRTAENVRRLAIWIARPSNVSLGRVNSWISVAARWVAGEFELQLPTLGDGAQGFLEIPSFWKAQALSLKAMGVELRLPRDEEFCALKWMVLTGVRFTDQCVSLGHVVTNCCPNLQVLHISHVLGLRELILTSSSLIELRLTQVTDLEWISVTAPNLQRLFLMSCAALASNAGPEAVLVIAQKLNLLDWQGPCPNGVRFPCKTVLQSLCVSESSSEVVQHSSFMDILQKFRFAGILKVHIPITRDIEEHLGLIKRTKVPLVSELELFITTNGHAFGETVVSFFRICSGLRRLQLNLIYWDDKDDCMCGCQMEEGWDQDVRLDYLEEVIWTDFTGTSEEREFLIYLFERASSLRKFTLLGTAEEMAKVHEFVSCMCPGSCLLEFQDSTTK